MSELPSTQKEAHEWLSFRTRIRIPNTSHSIRARIIWGQIEASRRSGLSELQ